MGNCGSVKINAEVKGSGDLNGNLGLNGQANASADVDMKAKSGVKIGGESNFFV